MTPEDLGWVDRQQPKLVGWAETYVADAKIHEPQDERRGNKPKVSGSQLRNLLNSATQGSSLAVLRNFLRYQIGRGGKGWGDEPSGEALLSILDEKIGPLCRGRHTDQEAESGEAQGQHRIELEADVASKFFGFVIREYTYRCKLAGTQPR